MSSSKKPKPPILLSFLFLLASLAVAASQEFTYKGFSASGAGKNPSLSLNGTSATDVLPSGVLRLTNETSRLLGHAFYPAPLRFLDRPNGTAVSFSTQFAFTIVPEFPVLGGHGFAFVVAPDPRMPGALPSQYLGLLSAADVGNATNHLFAVEFDTVQDFEFDDVNGNHVGVNLNSLISNASAKADPLNLKAGDTTAWIDYDGAAGLLNVSIANGTALKPAAPLISFRVDLSGVFREQMYVGFSASTGSTPARTTSGDGASASAAAPRRRWTSRRFRRCRGSRAAGTGPRSSSLSRSRRSSRSSCSRAPARTARTGTRTATSSSRGSSTTTRTGSSTPSSGERRAGSGSASCWAAAVGGGGIVGLGF